MSDLNEQGEFVGEPTPGAPVIIDLGKHRKKRIKALRKGRQGKLMDEVMTALESLRAAGTVKADAQPVIVVVRQRRGSKNWFGL